MLPRNCMCSFGQGRVLCARPVITSCICMGLINAIIQGLVCCMLSVTCDSNNETPGMLHKPGSTAAAWHATLSTQHSRLDTA